MTRKKAWKRAALYARVSTRDQNAGAQLDALRAWASSADVPPTEYVDEGQSGARASRPALDAMLAAARRREVSVVACVKLDRLARSVRHLTELAAELEALGVDLVVLDQAIDTSTPSGRLLFNVLGSIAEFERDLIRDRTRAGIAAARRRGVKLGRPTDLTGERLKRARRLEAGGASHRRIADLLGASKSAVSRALRGK